jgi:hypothetical protein
MKRGIITIMICAVSFCAQPAQATLITIQIEAVVDSVWDGGNYLEGKIKVGDTITGSYTYDSDMPDSAPETWLGKYEYSQAPSGMYLDVGGFKFETDPGNVDFNIYISNDRLSPSGDIYSIVSNSNLPLSNGIKIGWMFWQLNDYSGQAISNTNLTLTAPILADWKSGNLLYIEGVPRQTDFIIHAHVISAIPEPATILLFSFVLLLMRKRN